MIWAQANWYKLKLTDFNTLSSISVLIERQIQVLEQQQQSYTNTSEFKQTNKFEL